MILIVSNAFILLVPLFLWNLFFTRYLPVPYGSADFDRGIPGIVIWGERIFRIVIFMVPLFLRTDVAGTTGKWGLVIYLGGMVLYFLSWVILIKKPKLKWCQSGWGFTAPAYTPIIWLTGMALLADSWYLNVVDYEFWHFLVPAVLFTGFHTCHALLAFLKKHKAYL